MDFEKFCDLVLTGAETFFIVVISLLVTVYLGINAVAIYESSIRPEGMQCKKIGGFIPLCYTPDYCGGMMDTDVDQTIEKNCFENGEKVNCSKIEED